VSLVYSLMVSKVDLKTKSPPAKAFIQEPSLEEISLRDLQLEEHFQDKFLIERTLTRPLVSFQANKQRPAYRWYKYKEAFSASMVEFLLNKYGITSGKLLDPFAGIGTALFASSGIGMDSDGIELLPIGQEVLSARLTLQKEFTEDDFATLNRWLKEHPWKKSKERVPLLELRITAGAYLSQTHEAIECYMGACKKENIRVQNVLRLALLSILESISYTRKDGQYLRWDSRSGRRLGGKPFDKGPILDFDRAITTKLKEILFDAQTGGSLFPSGEHVEGQIKLIRGSCLDGMPKLPPNTYEVILTSPPYCNRYDYTRTYALELALLGLNEQDVVNLRQEMVTCTVENRAKDLLSINPRWDDAVEAADQQELLQIILHYLEYQKIQGKLNNNSIPRMVRGYFYEMACVIAECVRVMKPNGVMFMVNDNVRYAGASISVDMILSNIAEKLGLEVKNILVLPRGKGNSSQQMGTHGRKLLRKCVYVWRKPT